MKPIPLCSYKGGRQTFPKDPSSSQSNKESTTPHPMNKPSVHIHTDLSGAIAVRNNVRTAFLYP
jgi:hypothetical protein